MHPVEVGRVGAPQGVRGWVRIQSWTRPPEAILEFDQLWIEAQAPRSGTEPGPEWDAYEVADGATVGKTLALKLRGVDDRERAVGLRHARLFVDRAQLPRLAEGEWYWADLEGLEVVTTDGTALGRIDHLLETGANDVLVVKGERERLIPWIGGEVVASVEPEAGRVVVDWDPEF